jgi:(E)-4-hydroxy-3-methylbut-2-enyl-diphosphate synthase
MLYCEEIFETKRRKTREVKVGSVGIGGNNPVRIQSMTTSNTRDVEATVLQILRLEQEGCEIARMTVQGMKEAEACELIANSLIQKRCTIPLVADIHFYPPAAMKAVEFVDKVRINPGNFADKRALFIQKDYDESSYERELLKIEEIFVPLVEKCKALKKSMRIGTNHGSLSDRIMNRYGDTPHGMVESALEFTRICRKYDFHDLVFSMKSSNPLVMIQAYRLLAGEMLKLNWDYPFHLGVTEAGEGEDGRIKSSIGIGSLLLDGIGDTIRVSLTEDPWQEIDPCKRLISWAEGKTRQKGVVFQGGMPDPYSWKKSPSLIKSPLHPDGSVLMKVSGEEVLDSDFFIGWDLTAVDKPDLLWIPDISSRQWSETAQAQKLKDAGVEVLTQEHVVFLEDAKKDDSADQVLWIRSTQDESLQKMLEHSPKFFLFSGSEGSFAHHGRKLFAWMQEKQIKIPVILLFNASNLSAEDGLIHCSAECGSLLISGMFDGICLESQLPFLERKKMSFALLQAARKKATKTEFISCPGCGRTLFDLQSVSRRIRDRTSHLPGVRIAIMGCIVNGPGEMADADFGYVGSKAGKIDLYVGKQCVERNIDFQDADDRLIALIKSYGKWIDPVVC